MNRIEFELDGLPKTTNAFKRSHWTHSFKERKRWKTFVFYKLGEFRWEKFSKPRLTLTRFSTTEPDFDGLVSSFKAVIDGLKVAGVIEDDKQSIIGQPLYKWEYAPPRKGKIRVVVEEAS